VGRTREEGAVANGSGLLTRPDPGRTSSPPSLPAPAPSWTRPAPDLASRRVRRNRALMLLLLLAFLAGGLWLSVGRGRNGTAAPRHRHLTGTIGTGPPSPTRPTPGSTPIGRAMENRSPWPSAVTSTSPRGAHWVTAWPMTLRPLSAPGSRRCSRGEPQHGQPRDGTHQWHLPRPVTQDIRLLRSRQFSGAAATAALQNWANARTCTDLTPAAGAPEASTATETSPAPPAVVQQLSQDT
jgi:hypothetical protein